MSDKIVMLTKRKKNFVQFYYDGESPPFICGAEGHFTSVTLGDIEEDFLFENDDSFNKGAGDYLFQVNYEPEQYGEYGAIEMPALWDLSEVLFEPAEEGNKLCT